MKCLKIQIQQYVLLSKSVNFRFMFVCFFFSHSKVIAFAAIVGVAVALPAPQELPGIIPTISHSEVRDDAGQYALSYSTGNGIALSERGVLKRTPDGFDNVLVKEVSFSFLFSLITVVTN